MGCQGHECRPRTTGTYADLISLGDTLCDTDNETDLVLDGLDDGVGSRGWRDIEDRGIGFSLTNSLENIS